MSAYSFAVDHMLSLMAAVGVSDYNRLVKPLAKTGNVSIDSIKHDWLVQQDVGTAKGSSTMSYSISPYIQ